MPTPQYWFPAKRYGWGWSMPTCWQGWAALVAYIVAFVIVAVHYPPNQQPARFALGAAILTLILLAICWLKGEPPRWRWGDD